MHWRGITLVLAMVVCLGGAWAEPEALTVTFAPTTAVEYSLVPVTPVVTAQAPVVLLAITPVHPGNRQMPEFYHGLYGAQSYVFHEHKPLESPNRGPVALQSLGAYTYAPVIAPGKAGAVESRQLAFPVGSAAQVTVPFYVNYLTPTPEQLVARCVIMEPHKAHKAANYDDVQRALAAGTPVNYGLGTPATVLGDGPIGSSFAPAAASPERRSGEYSLTVTVTRRAVAGLPSSAELQRRERRPVEWFFDNAWVLREDDDSATLLRANGATNWPSVQPAFFAGVTPAVTIQHIGVPRAFQDEFHRRFPRFTIVEDMGGPHFRLEKPMTVAEVLAFSHTFDGSVFALSGSPWDTPFIMRSPAKLPLDAATVQRKIAALGVRDDTLADDERPEAWLAVRCRRIVPQLVAGLDHRERRVAEGCLRLLEALTARPEVKEAVVRIAGDPDHLLGARALLLLPNYADDPRAVRLMEANYGTDRLLPRAEDRATLALAIGRKADAVALLATALEQRLAKKEDYEAIQLITRLREIGDPTALPVLEKTTRVLPWRVAAPAYLALGLLDPRDHVLTADQRTFLEQAGRWGKWDSSALARHVQALAALNRTQVRPYVLQMLQDRQDSQDALLILAAWQDKDALPEIRRYLQVNDFNKQEAIIALLAIAGVEEATPDILKLLAAGNEFEDELVLRAVGLANLPIEQHLALYRTLRTKLGDEGAQVIPHSLAWARNSRDIAPLLAPLMAEEADLQALGAYAERARQDDATRYTTSLQRAVKVIAAAPMPAEYGRETGAMQRILEAAAAGGVTGVDTEIDTLLAAPHATIRLATAHLAAGSPTRRAQGLTILQQTLVGDDKDARQLAAEHLLQIPTANEQERAERERLCLTQVGKPAEDYALRVLITCAGTETARALEPLLEEDFSRAIYAAWVLAHLREQPVGQKALRRLAINGQFHHYLAQQGSGISFMVAPGLGFSQETSNLNRPPRVATDPQAMVLPDTLLGDFPLDAAEQAFAIRAYRAAVRVPNEMMIAHGNFLRGGSARKLEASYLPLLRVIATEDPYLHALQVNDKRVAHFPFRKQAAEAMAAITGKPASYRGLAGEEIASDAFPKAPYPDQTPRVAAYFLDRVQADRKEPTTDAEWNVITGYNTLLRQLRESFGEDMLAAVKAEATRRGMLEQLRTARISL